MNREIEKQIDVEQSTEKIGRDEAEWRSGRGVDTIRVR